MILTQMVILLQAECPLTCSAIKDFLLIEVHEVLARYQAELYS